ncbi:MAG: CRISPR-associated protein Cas4 [Nitrospirales bacterium]|nr:CRISPR-associated protein Cas4 [Nitrospirales bacterium]
MSENDGDQILVTISALNQYAYCPRRCALILIEQTFDDNVYTMRGRDIHERVDQASESGFEEGVRIERGLPLWNQRLGLIGKADVVEFHGDIPYPVEYKSGGRRQWDNDDLQLCAQAICLEEMTGQEVSCGAIYHFKSRRRREVVFDQPLRDAVSKAVQDIRNMLGRKKLPPPVNDKRCEHCSLQESCMPSLLGEQARAQTLADELFSIKDS